MNFLLNILIKARMFWIGKTAFKELLTNAENPEETQWKLLKRILKSHEHTLFGKKYGFSEISTYDEYIEKVPVHTYEELRGYIEQQRESDKCVLNAEKPLFYAVTSGTTGKPKYIPILQSTIDEYKTAQNIVSYTVFQQERRTYDGKIMAIVSPAIEGYLEGGSPFGAMSGLVQQSMPALTRKKYLLPPAVLEIKNAELKYLLIATFAVYEQKVSLFATANPSTIVRVLDVMNQNIEAILKAIEHGDLKQLFTSSETVPKGVSDAFSALPRRSEEIREIMKKKKSPLTYADLWPNIRTVTCWTKAFCAVLIPQAKEYFPNTTRFIELGYIASELRGSVPIDGATNRCLPTLHQNFFEFVEKNKREEGEMCFLRLHQLEQQKQYYLFATTSNGLYRYDINDIVEVNGFYAKTPLFDFVQKGRGVTNLTGEKLYEGQIVHAIQRIQKQRGFKLTFFLVVADHKLMQYQLYAEAYKLPSLKSLSEEIERELSHLNIEYATKRESGRLLPIKLISLRKGAMEAYKKHLVKQGKREGQFKVVPLVYRKDCDFPFHRWIENEDKEH